MFRPCSRFGPNVLEVSFGAWYVSTREVCFDLLELCFRQSSRYGSTVHEVCSDRARGMFRPSSSHVSTDLMFVSTMHEVCFDCRSRYVSTVLEIYFDRARSVV